MSSQLPSVGSDEFHVFLSHNSNDRNAVCALKVQLEERGLKCWLDQDELRPGLPWQKLLEEGIQSSKSVLVTVADSGLGPWEEEEMFAALELAVRNKLPVIPVLLPKAKSKLDLPLFLANRTWVDLRQGFTKNGVDRLVWGITGNKPPRNGDHVAPPEEHNGTSRRFFWLGIGMALAISLLATVGMSKGCSPKPSPIPKPDPTPVAIGIKEWIGYTPFAVAKQMKLFPSDIDVTFVKVNSAQEVNDQLGEDIQLGFLTIADLVGQASGIFRYRPNHSSRPVALFMVDTSRGADGFVFREGIQSVEELAGKKFLYQKDDVSDFMLRQYCDWKKIDYKKLVANAEDQKPTSAADKFRRDEDSEYLAAGTYEPHLSKITEEKDCHIAFDSSHTCIDGSIVDIAVAEQEFLTSHPDAVRSLMIGWFRAVNLLNNKDSTQTDVKQAIDLARKFNSRSEIDNWDVADWPEYPMISIRRFKNATSGLSGRGSANPWPDLKENREFFRPNGSTTSATSKFHDQFRKWQDFLKKGDVAAKDFDGSTLGTELSTAEID